MKVEHISALSAQVSSSVMLTGDSDAETWRYAIQRDYSRNDLSCNILVAGHHGSITFFDDPADSLHYYTDHVQAMAPAMTLISVGPNSHGHPNPKAIDLYEKYSSGSNKGNKIRRTDKDGNMHLILNDSGWNLNVNQ